MGGSATPEIAERGNWTGKLDFLLSCLGYAVGLGNVWRFPYLCFKHGGGAFLIPYALMLAIIGIPCFFLEITIGQYAAMGPVTIYSNLSPLFKGLGFANFMASAFVGLYYNMIIAWTIYYLFASFTSQLPWDNSCQNDFNTEFCFSINSFKECIALREKDENFTDAIYHNGNCLTTEDQLNIRNNISHFYACTYKNKTKDENGTEIEEVIGKGGWTSGIVYLDPDATEGNDTTCGHINSTYENGTLKFPQDKLFDIPKPLRKTEAAEYLEISVLNQSDGLENMGEVQWHLCLCLLAAWIIIFLCLIKGIKSSGKVVYFTATYPYFVLVILLIKAATLEGAIDGIRFYMVPDWSRLSDIKVWEGAAVQIFFSLSVAGGGLITLASYNEFKNNVIRDTFIVCLGNCLTSVFAGFCIFSVLGFMARELGQDVTEVVTSGSGLAFIAYPDLVTRFPAAPFWSILFFSMLFTLGLDSQFAIVETILTGVLDFEPRLRSKKTYILGGICIIGFICGLPLTTRGGGYLIDLLDTYAAGWPYLFIGLCELIIIGHIYGVKNFFDDLYSIVKHDMGPWLKTNIYFIYMTLSPAVIGVILIISWANHEPLTKGDYQYPEWADAIGWIIALTLILSVPIVAIVQVIMKTYQESKRAGFNFISDFPSIVYNLAQHTGDWRNNAYKELQVQENGNTEKGLDNEGANTTD